MLIACSAGVGHALVKVSSGTVLSTVELRGSSTAVLNLVANSVERPAGYGR